MLMSIGLFQTEAWSRLRLLTEQSSETGHCSSWLINGCEISLVISPQWGFVRCHVWPPPPPPPPPPHHSATKHRLSRNVKEGQWAQRDWCFRTWHFFYLFLKEQYVGISVENKTWEQASPGASNGSVLAMWMPTLQTPSPDCKLHG